MNAANNNYWGAIIKKSLNVTPNGIGLNNKATDLGEILSTEYYNVAGVKIANPRNGIFIARKTFSNGEVKTSKVWINENGIEK